MLNVQECTRMYKNVQEYTRMYICTILFLHDQAHCSVSNYDKLLSMWLSNTCYFAKCGYLSLNNRKSNLDIFPLPTVLIITRSHFSFELRFCPDQIQMNTMGTKS